MKMKYLVFCLVLASLFINCDSADSPENRLSSVINEQVLSAQNAGEALCKEILTAKIVFLSELHTVVNPLLFLAEHLKSFYDVGIRFIFIEGNFSTAEKGDFFYMFYPWQNAGWKYEEKILIEAIQKINEDVNDLEKLRVIWAEKGLCSRVKTESQRSLFLKRDIFAANTIINMLTFESGKALVFYGGNHGLKLPVKNYKINGENIVEWKSLSYYLAQYYGEQFKTFDYFITGLHGIQLYNALPNAVMLHEEDLAEVLTKQNSGMRDGYIIDSNPVYGIYYQYIPTQSHLRFLLEHTLFLLKNIDIIKADDTYIRYEKRAQFLMLIYYLKLYFGQKFPYTFWNPEMSLSQALYELRKVILKDETQLLPVIELPDLADIRAYHENMVKDGAIESYLVQPDIRFLPQIRYNLKKAKKLFSADAWAFYWLAFFQTEIAKKSKLESSVAEYKIALDSWQEFFTHPMSYCMEILPLAYRKAIYCAKQLGYEELVAQYMKTESSLENEFHLDVQGFLDTGYGFDE